MEILGIKEAKDATFRNIFLFFSWNVNAQACARLWLHSSRLSRCLTLSGGGAAAEPNGTTKPR